MSGLVIRFAIAMLLGYVVWLAFSSSNDAHLQFFIAYVGGAFTSGFLRMTSRDAGAA